VVSDGESFEDQLEGEHGQREDNEEQEEAF
jgi:hypothetical protein